MNIKDYWSKWLDKKVLKEISQYDINECKFKTQFE
jgi:hypothetical protein